LNVNAHGALNEKFIREIIKLKKSEFKIYQNIFNIFYYEYDILKFKEQEKNKKMEEDVKIELLLVVFKNLLKNYGNISQIYLDNPLKKILLKNCLNKHGLIEKTENENSINSNMDMLKKNQENNDKNMENKNNKKSNDENIDKKKNDIEKFRVINEVDEEKEDENDEEDDKYDIIQNDFNPNQTSYTNSNIKDSNFTDNFISNEKIKSEKNVINEQKKLFDKEYKENDITNKNENKIKNKNKDLEKIKHPQEEEKYNNQYINNINISSDKNNNENLKEEGDHDNNIDNEIEEEIIHKTPLKKIDKNKEKPICNPVRNESEKFNKKANYENDIVQDDTLNKLNKQFVNVNEIITNNIDSEKDEIKSLRKEKIITKEETEKNIEYDKKNENRENNKYERERFNTNIIYNKSRIKKKEKKEVPLYDEEDLKMQKLLIEEFPKKCKEENKFIRKTKNEYLFGDETIKVELVGDDVILKLDEGDYKLQEFIDILNEGKEEEENEQFEEKDYEEEEYKNSSNKKDLNSSEDHEKSKKRKRKKRVSEEMSEEDEENNQEEINNNNEIEYNYNENINVDNKNIDNNYYDNNFSDKKSEKKEEKYMNIHEKENYNANEIIDKIDFSEKNEVKYSSGNQNQNGYYMKRRRDYKMK
jgi:hypothetical protein